MQVFSQGTSAVPEFLSPVNAALRGTTVALGLVPSRGRGGEQAPDLHLHPLGNQRSRPPKGKVDKCTFCAHFVDQRGQPACVIACPAEARVFGDLSDPNSPVSELLANRRGLVLRPDFGTRPMVYYLK